MKTKRIIALEARRDEIVRQMDELDELVITRGSALNDDEQAKYNAFDNDLTETTSELEKLVKRAAMVEGSLKLGAELGQVPTGGARVTSDEQIYRADQPDTNFFLDLVRSKQGNRDANERMHRHLDIVRAAATSAELAGVVVPRYTTDLVGVAREGRPFLNTLQSRPVLGMTTIVPRVVTAPTVAAQATENTAFDTTALDTEEVSITTTTVAGYTDLSVQAIDFGVLDQNWVMQELLSALYQKMDYYALNGLGTGAQPEGLFEADNTNVVDADSVSGFAEHYATVIQAASLIRKNDFRTATHVVMSPERWYALLSSTDSEGRPLAGILGSSPVNVGGNTQVQGGVFAGLPVVIDQNVVRTGEDDTFMGVYHAPAIWFAESPTTQLVCDCVVGHTGTVRFILRAYMQFSAEVRPKATTIVQDLTVPEFPTLAIS